MQTFAELLTEYMARTGISDSELARSLGVRRQTIFRWKEGLVTKPRNREDVLRCADRLRLLPDECDALLIAAGFPPEKPQPVTSSNPDGTQPATEPIAPPSGNDREQLVNTLQTANQPSHSTIHTAMQGARQASRKWIPMPVRSAGRWIWIGCALLLLIMAAVALTYVLTREEFGAVFPIAEAGESLIVLAPITNTSGDSQPVSRALSALRREIEAARLGGVRVEIWPDDIQDSSAADKVRSRARASLVIWGTLAESRLVVRLSQSRTTDGTDRLLPGTLVHPPNDFDMTIESASLEEFRLLALITLGALYLNTDDAGQGRAILTQALAYSGARPDTLSALYSLLGYSFHKSGAEGLSQAIEYYTRAIEAVPDAATAYSYRGTAYIKRNMPQEWQRDLEQALAFQPDNLMAQQALCAGYALDAQPQAALPLCDAAVRNDSTAISRESRAVVYAQLGRYPEAIEDLNFLLKWLEGQPERLRERYGPLRANWLTELEAGRNPFSERVLEELRQE